MTAMAPIEEEAVVTLVEGMTDCVADSGIECSPADEEKNEVIVELEAEVEVNDED